MIIDGALEAILKASDVKDILVQTAHESRYWTKVSSTSGPKDHEVIKVNLKMPRLPLEFLTVTILTHYRSDGELVCYGAGLFAQKGLFASMHEARQYWQKAHERLNDRVQETYKREGEGTTHFNRIFPRTFSLYDVF
ncbi:hypothetical protein JW711_03145 [Candidatus Woesearchaeota archaeon]|nr:hypothetical protein [Candidatus Woesearchaeota archaeon]